MKCKLSINENNQILVYEFGEGDIEVPSEIILGINQGNLYKYIDGEFIRDLERESKIFNQIEIEELKQKLVETDYIVAKSMEYQIKNLDIPENYFQIMENREEWRKRINELEG